MQFIGSENFSVMRILFQPTQKCETGKPNLITDAEWDIAEIYRRKLSIYFNENLLVVNHEKRVRMFSVFLFLLSNEKAHRLSETSLSCQIRYLLFEKLQFRNKLKKETTAHESPIASFSSSGTGCTTEQDEHVIANFSMLFQWKHQNSLFNLKKQSKCYCTMYLFLL